MLDIIIQNDQSLAAPPPPQLIDWATRVLAYAEVDTAEIGIRIVDTSESRQLNKRYRGHDKPTNVLSFLSDIPAELALGLIGDLAICSDIVYHEAHHHGLNPDARWCHMIVHGLLHLLGYDHITPDDAAQMEAIERKLLINWGYNDPYDANENNCTP